MIMIMYFSTYSGTRSEPFWHVRFFGCFSLQVTVDSCYTHQKTTSKSVILTVKW